MVRLLTHFCSVLILDLGHASQVENYCMTSGMYPGISILVLFIGFVSYPSRRIGSVGIIVLRFVTKIWAP